MSKLGFEVIYWESEKNKNKITINENRIRRYTDSFMDTSEF